jgi:hypothetical protein
MQAIRCLIYFLKNKYLGQMMCFSFQMGQAFWSLEVIIFDSIRFFFFKEQNRFFKKEKPKPVQTDWFRSGSVSLEQKPIKIDLARFCFQFFFVWVRFFQFQAYKTEPDGFLKILIGFFTVQFFYIFFSVYLV